MNYYLIIMRLKNLLYVIQFYIILFIFFTSIFYNIQIKLKTRKMTKDNHTFKFEFHGSMLKYRPSQLQ